MRTGKGPIFQSPLALPPVLERKASGAEPIPGPSVQQLGRGDIGRIERAGNHPTPLGDGFIKGSSFNHPETAERGSTPDRAPGSFGAIAPTHSGDATLSEDTPCSPQPRQPSQRACPALDCGYISDDGREICQETCRFLRNPRNADRPGCGACGAGRGLDCVPIDAVIGLKALLHIPDQSRRGHRDNSSKTDHFSNSPPCHLLAAGLVRLRGFSQSDRRQRG